MPKVMFKMIALILEAVEGFIFNLPAGASAAHQGIGIAFADGEVCNPGEMAGFIPLDFPVFQEVDPHIGIRFVERHIVEKTKTMAYPLGLHLKLRCFALRMALMEVIKQISVVARLDTQDETQIVTFEFFDVRCIGTQGVLSDDDGQVQMVLAQQGQKAIGCIAFTVVLLFSILFDDRFWSQRDHRFLVGMDNRSS